MTDISEHDEIPGLFTVSDFIDDIEEELLRRAVTANDVEWDCVGGNPEKSRRVLHYGYKYNYRSKHVNKSDYLGSLPKWSSDLEQKIYELPIIQKLQSGKPNQLIVNEYKPGQGIAWHTDAKSFDDPIVTLSTGGSCIFEMKNQDGKVVELLLKPKTLVVMSGKSRWDWKHRIPARAVDRFEGEDYRRHKRISFTYRWVPKH